MKRIAWMVVPVCLLVAAPVWSQVNLKASIAQLPVLSESPEKGIFVELVKASGECGLSHSKLQEPCDP